MFGILIRNTQQEKRKSNRIMSNSSTAKNSSTRKVRNQFVRELIKLWARRGTPLHGFTHAYRGYAHAYRSVEGSTYVDHDFVPFISFFQRSVKLNGVDWTFM